ncbi:MAG: hypothetical protein GF364_08655, partial [Candidatus Lokiarchaeota archaeon]|nr:hypothetical protein [Candidatus Lokiarchaeota archaeon]
MKERDIEKDYRLVVEKFKDFKSYLAIDNFRSFLLLVLSNENDDLINRVLEGGNPNRSIWYDIKKESFVYELAVTSENRIIIYFKSPLEMDEKIIESDNVAFYDKYLSKFEQELLVDKKLKLQIVRYLDKVDDVLNEYEKGAEFEVTRVFSDLISYLFAVGQIKSILVLDGENDEPDI